MDSVVGEEEDGLLDGDVEEEELVGEALGLVRAEVGGGVLEEVWEGALECFGLGAEVGEFGVRGPDGGGVAVAAALEVVDYYAAPEGDGADCEGGDAHVFAGVGEFAITSG